ncbi:MAG: uracil-DNA glycosylase [Methylovirgula sp.]
MRDGKRKIGPSGPGATEPPQDCPRCPRLATFRRDNRAQFPDWFNAPVPTFAGKDPRLIIVGLAPGLRGANRTGRPFTGDFAGVLLYETLTASGLAQGSYAQSADDGLTLTGCAITNAVRCVPPQNKPLPAEITNCRPFLAATIAATPHLQAVLALGRIAHEQVLRALGLRLADWPFRHGRRHDLPATDARPALTLFDSYHCSRYNTNTGVLSAEMFRAVIEAASAAIGSQPADAG